MFYIKEYIRVGDWPEEFPDDDYVEITTQAPKTNSSGEVRIGGWLGADRVYSVTAHGAYETLEKARESCETIFECLRKFEDDETENSDYFLEKYKIGKYNKMDLQESSDWAFDFIARDIKESTTNCEIEKLFDLYNDEAKSDGAELDYQLVDAMKAYRDELKN